MRDRRGPPARPYARRYALADQQALAEFDSLHGNQKIPLAEQCASRQDSPPKRTFPCPHWPLISAC